MESESLLILQGPISRRAWCPQCRSEREVIALAELGVISNLERSALQKWLNFSDLHRLQAADRSALICLHSLLARVLKQSPFETKESTDDEQE